jgi:hypothetical protein
VPRRQARKPQCDPCLAVRDRSWLVLVVSTMSTIPRVPERAVAPPQFVIFSRLHFSIFLSGSRPLDPPRCEPLSTCFGPRDPLIPQLTRGPGRHDAGMVPSNTSWRLPFLLAPSTPRFYDRHHAITDGNRSTGFDFFDSALAFSFASCFARQPPRALTTSDSANAVSARHSQNGPSFHPLGILGALSRHH